MGSAVDKVTAIFEDNGWTVQQSEPVSGAVGRPNPSRVVFLRGKTRLSLLMYAWNITHEGKGRDGNNYRVQATRAHKGDLLSEAGRYSIGVGIDTERDVLAVFDAWTKRTTGKSNSVHIKRTLLDAAATNGYSSGGPPWDARAACRFDNLNPLPRWINCQLERRFVGVKSIETSIDGAVGEITAIGTGPAGWLREGDRFALVDGPEKRRHLVDDSVWRVTAVDTSVKKASRNERHRVHLRVERYARIKNSVEMINSINDMEAQA